MGKYCRNSPWQNPAYFHLSGFMLSGWKPNTLPFLIVHYLNFMKGYHECITVQYRRHNYNLNHNSLVANSHIFHIALPSVILDPSISWHEFIYVTWGINLCVSWGMQWKRSDYYSLVMNLFLNTALQNNMKIKAHWPLWAWLIHMNK